MLEDEQGELKIDMNKLKTLLILIFHLGYALILVDRFCDNIIVFAVGWGIIAYTFTMIILLRKEESENE